MSTQQLVRSAIDHHFIAHRNLDVKVDRRDVTLIIADCYARAKARADELPAYYDRDWYWFADAKIARQWLKRCNERGVFLSYRMVLA